MKKTLFVSLLLTFPCVYADSEIVPLDVEVGLWESNAELVFSKEIEDMLKSVPEAQRSAMKQMIDSQSKMPSVTTCITDEDQKNFDKQILDSLGEEEGCKMTLKESTAQSFTGEYQCEEITATFSIEVVNSKRHITEVVSYANGVEQSKMRMVADWKGADCPADAIRNN